MSMICLPVVIVNFIIWFNGLIPYRGPLHLFLTITCCSLCVARIIWDLKLRKVYGSKPTP